MQVATEVAATSETLHFSVARLLRSIFIDGGRFWERGRLAYNAIQLFLTAVMLVIRWRDAHFFADNLGVYIAFAIIANVLYTAAYLPEAILQIPQLRPFTTFLPIQPTTNVTGSADAAANTLSTLTCAAGVVRDSQPTRVIRVW